jgi:hypothetical protein
MLCRRDGTNAFNSRGNILIMHKQKSYLPSVAQRGVLVGCSPPGKFYRGKYQRGTKVKIYRSLPPLKISSEKYLNVKFNPPPLEF